MTANRAFGGIFIVLDEKPVACRTRLRKRPFPVRPFTGRIIAAPIKNPSAFRSLFYEIAATEGARDSYFDQNLLGITALREMAATDEATVAALTINQRVPAKGAISAHEFWLFA